MRADKVFENINPNRYIYPKYGPTTMYFHVSDILSARIAYDAATNQVWLQGFFDKFKFARKNFRYGAADGTYGRSIYTGTTFEQLSELHKYQKLISI